jgi:hypothetical protein
MEDNPNQNFSSMIDSLSEDVGALVREHVDLAKSEIIENAKRVGMSLWAFLFAGLFVSMATVFTLFALAYGISTRGVPVWVGFLIVSGIMMVMGLVFFVLAKAQLRKIGRKNRTGESLKTTVEAFADLAGKTIEL